MHLPNLDKLIAEKYISVQKHPEFDLYIYNYTPRAQFDRVWTEETLACRGLIMDGSRNVVSRPFRKFFNFGELPVSQSRNLQKQIESGEVNFTVTEKMDGSLGISYFGPDGTMYIATRGSFVSEQAQKANHLLDEKYSDIRKKLNEDFTFLFEIVYPQNRIVVDYGSLEDLVLLAVIDTETGKEKPYETLIRLGETHGFPVVKRYDGITDFDNLISRENSEGYVVYFPKTGLRFKAKFEEYTRLHRILTGINAKRIWEFLSTNQSLDEILDRVPDEFYKWVESTVTKLRMEHDAIVLSATDLCDQIKVLPTRKDQALAIKDHPYKGLVFGLLDGKDIHPMVWKMQEPAFDKPFKMDEV